jgi:hypothetical protein
MNNPMMWLTPETYMLFSFIAFAIGAFAFLRTMRLKYGERLNELELAEDQLNTFFVTAAELESDPRTPARVREFINDCVYVLAHHKVVAKIAEQLSQKQHVSPPHARASTARLLDELTELRRSAPELETQFKKLLMSGLVAMMLRSPETRSLALRVAAKSSDSNFVPKGSESIFAAVPADCVPA